jgi:uncharacterized delta-60 repeat protein
MLVRTLYPNRRFSAAALSLFVIVFVLTVSPIDAQIDPTFGTNGVAIANAGTNKPLGHFVLPNGKILVISRDGGTPSRLCFVRLNDNGTPDGTYGTNGIIQVTVPYTNPNQGRIHAAARQADGKIILVGRDDSNRGIIVRYNENATLDASFGVGGVHRPDIGQAFGHDALNSVLVLADGKILVAGYAEADGTSYPKLSLLRYLANGTLDTGFGGSGTGFVIHSPIVLPFQDGAEVFTLQSDGKIIVGNRYETETGGTYPTRTRIYRFNADGSIDTGFTVLSFPHHNILGTLLCAFVQPDDKILVGTQSRTNDVLEIVHLDAEVTRYNPNGDIDTSFGTAGRVAVDIANHMTDRPLGFQVLADGQIVVATYTNVVRNRGAVSGNYLAYARLSPAGVINGKFLAAHAGLAESDRINTSVSADGKILTAIGAQGLSNVALVRAVGVSLQNYVFHTVPFAFGNPLAGLSAQPSIYRPSDGSWRVYPFSPRLTGFGNFDDILVPSDYISDLSPDLAYFRPSNGTWYISATDYNVPITSFLTIQWGLSGDIPAPADYDGDGKSDVAVFRPSNGVWYIRNSSDGSFRFVQWGLNGDKPAVGDFDGDQKYDIAVFRPSDGNWYIIRSSDGGFTILHFGLDGDIPVQEDYDGDGKFDISVYRPSSGVWYRLNSSDGSFFYYQWGLSGDIPVPAEYDRDGKINIAVWRPSNGYWYIVNPDLTSMHFYIWGNPTDIPLPGKF